MHRALRLCPGDPAGLEAVKPEPAPEADSEPEPEPEQEEEPVPAASPQKWANVDAGPEQIRNLKKAMGALLTEGKSFDELTGVVGGEERRWTMSAPFSPVRPEVVALHEAIKARHGHKVTRATVRGIIADYQAALPEAARSRPTDDKRRTPEQEAERLAAEQAAEQAAAEEAERAEPAPGCTRVTIKHDHADGTPGLRLQPGDGIYELIGPRTAARFRYFPSIKMIGIPQSRDHLAKRWQIDQAAEALREAGHVVTVEIDDTPRDVTDVKADRAERLDDRYDRLSTKAERTAAEAAARHAEADRISAAVRRRAADPGRPPLRAGRPARSCADGGQRPRRGRAAPQGRACRRGRVGGRSRGRLPGTARRDPAPYRPAERRAPAD